jgi:PKD repeat protein
VGEAGIYKYGTYPIQFPAASFTPSATGVAVDADVTFTNTSTSMTAATYSWDFGDESTASTAMSPTHAYDTAGTYTVTLTVTNDRGVSTATENITAYDAPVAAFSADAVAVAVDADVTFTDESTNTPLEWAWDFGDDATSTEQNPVHAYAAAGTYTVTLTVTNPGGTDDEVKTDYITAYVAPVAAFSADVTEAATDATVTFTDESTGVPTEWLWDFGDDTTSTLQNPTHSYTAAGVYEVTLTVTNAAGTDAEVKADYIEVAVTPVAAFSATADAVPADTLVTFTDESTGVPTEWLWDFGDGSTSTLQNPTHEYDTAAGTYTVTLTVSNAGGEDTETKTEYITISGPGCCAASKATVAQLGSGIGLVGMLGLAATYFHIRKRRED